MITTNVSSRTQVFMFFCLSILGMLVFILHLSLYDYKMSAQLWSSHRHLKQKRSERQKGSNILIYFLSLQPCLGYYNQICQTQWLEQTLWRLGRCQQIRCLVRAPSCRQPLSCCVLTWPSVGTCSWRDKDRERKRGVSLFFL